MQGWTRVAVLSKAKSKDGGFAVRCMAGLSLCPDELFAEGREAAFVPPQLDLPRTGVVVDLVPTDSRTALVHFDTVSDLDTAARLEGSFVLLRDCDLPRPPAHTASLVGLLVEDARYGELGIVAGVEENPAHPLLRVQRQGSGEHPSPEGEFLIPYVDEFIVSVDRNAGLIRTAVPTGLLDL